MFHITLGGSQFLFVLPLQEAHAYRKSLKYAYFMSLGGYTDDAIKMIKDSISSDGKYKLRIFGPYAYFAFLEEREGKVHKVLPR